MEYLVSTNEQIRIARKLFMDEPEFVFFVIERLICPLIAIDGVNSDVWILLGDKLLTINPML